MADILITVSEETLFTNKKMQKILSEWQNRGLISIELVERKHFTLKPPSKSNKSQRQSPSPDDFVKAVKFIINQAAHQNGKRIDTIEKGGKVGYYVFWLDAEGWCTMMDKLLKSHRSLIESVLQKKQKADSVNLLAPFIGAILDEGLFQKSQKIQKVDLIHSFTDYYKKPQTSVKTQLSTSYPNRNDFNDLVEMAIMIAKGEWD